jgi:signal transduction histidine kinase
MANPLQTKDLPQVNPRNGPRKPWYIPRRSVRGRLTLLNLALISLLFCVLCLAQYFLLANFLKTTLINSLQTEARSAIEQRVGGPEVRDGGLERAGQRLTANFVSKTTLAVLIDSNGRVIKPALDTTSPTASDSQTGVGPEIDLASLDPALNQLAKPPSDLLQRALKGETGLSYTTNLAGWDEAVVVLVPFAPNNPPPQPRPPERGQPPARNVPGSAVLVIAGSNTANETTLADLLLINAGAFAVLLVVIGLASPLVAGSSLRPLRRMIKTTQQIAGGDLSRRVQLESDRDEIGQLAFSFNRMVDQLERQFKTQRQLVADASHELRTPLTAIKGSLEVMLLGGTASNPEAANRLLKTMHRESVRLTQLVNDLLTLSKLDQGEAVYLQPVNLLNLVQEVKAGIELFIQQGEKEISLAVEGFGSFGEPPVWVYGSPERLKQVLYNLLDNAVKFSPPDSTVILELGGPTRLPPGLNPLQRLPGPKPAETSNREQQYYRLSVKDQGPGIAPADLPHIFDRFYRGDTSRTRRNGGSGLGLAIAQAFLAAQGSFVTVESRLGQGTIFYVYLPAFKDGRSENPILEKNISTSPVS